MVKTKVLRPSETGHFCGLRMLRILVKIVRIKNRGGCDPIDVRSVASLVSWRFCSSFHDGHHCQCRTRVQQVPSYQHSIAREFSDFIKLICNLQSFLRVGIALAIGSGVFIGSSFVVKKKVRVSYSIACPAHPVMCFT